MSRDYGLFIGWNRPIVGRERDAMETFEGFMGYLESVKGQYVESYEPCILDQHGGDLNGFIVIRGDRDKLHELRYQDGWKDWLTKGHYNLDGFGVTRAFYGDLLKDHMGRFRNLIK